MTSPMPQDGRDDEFFPKGAIWFFVLLVCFFGVTWLGFYALMIGRH